MGRHSLVIPLGDVAPFTGHHPILSYSFNRVGVLAGAILWASYRERIVVTRSGVKLNKNIPSVFCFFVHDLHYTADWALLESKEDKSSVSESFFFLQKLRHSFLPPTSNSFEHNLCIPQHFLTFHHGFVDYLAFHTLAILIACILRRQCLSKQIAILHKTK